MLVCRHCGHCGQEAEPDDLDIHLLASGWIREGPTPPSALCGFCPGYWQRFHEEIFLGEDFIYLYDEFFTLGKMSSGS
jgi:hypothetical protein